VEVTQVGQVEISEAQRGATVAVRVGDRVVLRPADNPSTGYTWTLDDLPEGVQLIDDGYEQPGGVLPGAASTRRFEFTAAAPGHHRLRLVRARPGMSGASEAGSFAVELEASDE
jgi:predicted secreted protein